MVYLDASALVKRYVAERESAEMATMVCEAEIVGTAAISFTEVTAALAKAARLGVLDAVDPEEVLGRFREEWPDLISTVEMRSGPSTRCVLRRRSMSCTAFRRSRPRACARVDRTLG